MYVARRRIRVGSAYREPGEAVPEAASWPRSILDSNLGAGHLAIVPDGVSLSAGELAAIHPTTLQDSLAPSVASALGERHPSRRARG